MKIAMFGVKGIPVPAGAEKVAEQIGSRLVHRGHEVTVYVRKQYTPLSKKEYKGMRLVHLPSISSKNLEAITHSLLASIKVLKDKPDILHIHGIGSSIFTLHPRWFGITTVVQSHGLDWQRAKWGLLARSYLKLSDQSTVHFPTATTVVSQKMKRYYEQITGKTVHYIPNGVEPAIKAAPNAIKKWGLQGDDYILFAARLVPEKGAHYLIEAYKRLKNCKKKLVIAGDSDYDAKYVQSLKQHATEQIIFTGFVTGEPFRELLSNAYLFVLPSEIEGLSTGLLEAMSYGNCVLVSDIEENLEAIGEAGITFSSKDVDSLYLKLQTLVSDGIMVRSFQNRTLEHVQSKYNWEKVTDQFEELYCTLLSR